MLIHKYTATWELGLFGLSHSIHEKESDEEMKKFIADQIKDPYHSPTVFLIEAKKYHKKRKEAIIVEDGQLIQLTDEDAILAVKIIGCMPFTREKLIETINRELYTKFTNKYKCQLEKKEEEEKEKDDFDSFPELDYSGLF